jgi:diacylglycerol kinase (ATP)
VRVGIIANPSAGGGAKYAELEQAVRALPRGKEVVLEACPGPDALPGIVRDLVQGFEVVAAAGGDGTIHAVVNELVAVGARCRFGILPCGTGNDFSRSLAIPERLDDALAILVAGLAPAELDLIEVDAGETRTFAVNVCAGGFSGQMQEALSDELKQRWGPLAYVRGAFTVLPDLTGYETHVAFDDGSPDERVDVLNVIVANGRYSGGGLSVAPRASPVDGLLDVVLVRNAPLTQLAGVAGRLLLGDYLESDPVVFRRVRGLRLTAKPGMWFSVDGDLARFEHVSFRVRPAALQVLAGPQFAKS